MIIYFMSEKRCKIFSSRYIIIILYSLSEESVRFTQSFVTKENVNLLKVIPLSD